jgi:hypothetical protein
LLQSVIDFGYVKKRLSVKFKVLIDVSKAIFKGPLNWRAIRNTNNPEIFLSKKPLPGSPLGSKKYGSLPGI